MMRRGRGAAWAGSAALLCVALLVGSTVAQMRPGVEEREVRPEQRPFTLRGFLVPEAPMEGQTVEITGEIRSRVMPHIRTVVRFWVDGQKREETSYVISPFAESLAVHEWTAARGRHTIRIEVRSPAGALYSTWEAQVEVCPR